MDTYTSYAVYLQIRGFDIGERAISSLVQLECSSFYDERDKEEMPSTRKRREKSVEDIWSHNLWEYGLQAEGDTFESTMLEFLSSIKHVGKVPRLPSGISDVRVEIEMSCELAQMHIPFTPQILKEISDLEIPVDIRIFSHGKFEHEIGPDAKQRVTHEGVFTFIRGEKKLVILRPGSGIANRVRMDGVLLLLDDRDKIVGFILDGFSDDVWKQISDGIERSAQDDPQGKDDD